MSQPAAAGWLLDTNVVSELRTPRCDPAVRRWADATSDLCFVSRLTIVEIRLGIEKVQSAAKAAELSAWLAEVRASFGPRILDLDEPALLIWRRMANSGRKSGAPYSEPDLIVAATALSAGLVVATRNRKDFERTGVGVVDPWSGA